MEKNTEFWNCLGTSVELTVKPARSNFTNSLTTERIMLNPTRVEGAGERNKTFTIYDYVKKGNQLLFEDKAAYNKTKTF